MRLRRLLSTVRNIYRMNIFATILLNFRFLPFRQAALFPIIVYGKFKAHSLTGKIAISAPVKHSMIKIGYRWFDLFPIAYLPTQLWLSGNLEFAGSCIISGGCGIFVQKKTASIKFGNRCSLGAGSLIKSLDSITVGDYTCITGNCTIMDSNMHYVKNIETGLIGKPSGPIIIGGYCWINSGSIMTKGAIIPDYCIVARGSFINKSFLENGNNLFIVGSPAKIKGPKVQRIFNEDKEKELRKYFLETTSLSYDDKIGLYTE